MTFGKLEGRRWGIGPRRAVLLHGSTSSSATWWRIGPALAQRGWSVTALDLPSHGESPALDAPLLPEPAAAAVHPALQGRPVDLVVGHSFGAAVAVHLLAQHPQLAPRLVLEELPGPSSVAWHAEACAVQDGRAEAAADPISAVARTRAAQPRWADQDCRHSVQDLLDCRAGDVAAGLQLGPTWSPPALMEQVAVPVLLLLAPDAVGVNKLEDATALRGPDRAQAQAALRAQTSVLYTGHCLHRDDPATWLDAVTQFAAQTEGQRLSLGGSA